MLNLHSLQISPGSRRSPKRVGRGTGSGLGRNSGKGEKGQKSRSGGGVRLGFEGGQMPVYRTVPKRGFTNTRSKQYTIINIESLNVFDNNSEVTEDMLLDRRIVKKIKDGVKVLSRGELQKCLTVKVSKFSEEAKKKIEALGGKAEVI